MIFRNYGMTALFCVIIKGIMTDTGRGWKMGDNIFLKNSKKPELSDYMNFNVQSSLAGRSRYRYSEKQGTVPGCILQKICWTLLCL